MMAHLAYTISLLGSLKMRGKEKHKTIIYNYNKSPINCIFNIFLEYSNYVWWVADHVYTHQKR